MIVEKLVPKDRWPIPVPAEFSKSIGLYPGSPVFIELESDNNRIIITSSKSDSKPILEPQFEYSKEEMLNLIKYAIEKYDLKSDLVDFILSKKEPENQFKRVEKCAHCGKELQNHEQLKVNGKRICGECKKLEIQKLLLYIERRKVNEEARRQQKEEEND